MFIKDGPSSSTVFNGILGDIEVDTVYASKLNQIELIGTLDCNTQVVQGSNFDITGGVINGT